MEGEWRMRAELVGVIVGLLFLNVVLGGIALAVPAAASACAGVFVGLGSFGLLAVFCWAMG